MCTIIIESFLLDAHQKYLCLNYMQSSQYRSYKSHVPDYLHDKPKSTIVHCLESKSKALKYKWGCYCARKSRGYLTVKGSKDKIHTVSFGVEAEDGMPSCTCADWQQWHIPCKHFFAVFNIRDGWTWNRFHPNYLKSPYLSTDSVSLNDYFNDDTSCPTEGIEQSSLTQSPTPSGQGEPSELPKRQVFCYYINLRVLPRKFWRHSVWSWFEWPHRKILNTGGAY